ncbi:flagellar protein FlaG [Robertmurraya beringensis]|uniref:Flagellar protein FlaG n=1 Tax=Robertmurraya beringensis TaxID=641660 RepID=A0ABV6KX06_9BACI
MIDPISSKSIFTTQQNTLIEAEKNKSSDFFQLRNFTNVKDEIINVPQEKKQLEDVVKSLNDFLTPAHTSLKFKFHEKLNEYYVTLVDDKTNQVVKEIPSKKMLDFYAEMTEFIGIMVDKRI